MNNEFVSSRYYIDVNGNHSVRYNSGLSSREESLVDSRWVTSNVSTLGIVEEDPILLGSLIDNTAFKLEIDGQSLHRGWKYISFKKKERENGSLEVIVELENLIRPIGLLIHTLLDATSVMTRWLEIENKGNTSSSLSAVSPWSGRIFPTQTGSNEFKDFLSVFSPPRGPFSIGYFAQDKPFREGEFCWSPINKQKIIIGQNVGRSGWGHPIAYLRDEGSGQISVMQLAWSGNWSIEVKSVDYYQGAFRTKEKLEMLFASINVDGFAPQRVIQPGEIVKTPEVHLGTINGDISDMVQQLHAHQRKSVLPAHPKGRANLISYNHSGYNIIKNMTYDNLKREIDIAAELGAEVFTIDASWNGNDDAHWLETTGDWVPGNRLPDGLSPVFEYARSKGLLCGLWCWIEAANLKSKLIEKHPEWLLSRDGKRLDNLLDLSKQEVAQWVEDEMTRLVDEYGIDLLRIDYNASPGEGGYNSRDGFDEGTIWRHYETFYGILERIRNRYPELIIENCAGGGGRTDLGMMSRTHYTWLSDCVVVPHSIRLLNSSLLALAPQSTARFFGVGINGHLGGDLRTQLRANFMCGNPAIVGVWPDQKDKNPLLRDTVQSYVKLFKQHIRPMLNDCFVYHHTPTLPGNQASGWCVLEYANPSKTKSIIGVFRLDGVSEDSRTISPRGIDIEHTYSVYSDNDQKSFVCSGWDLVTKGLPARLSAPLKSEIFIIEKK